MTIGKVKHDKIENTTDSNKYENFDAPGVYLTNDNSPESTTDCKDYSFKVIRTPISCRTFMIGGKTNKGIRELVLRDNKPAIEYLICKYSVEASDDFSLFGRSSAMFILKSEESLSKSEEEKAEIHTEIVNKRMKEIEDIDVQKWVQRKKTHKDFKARVEKLAVKVRNEFKTDEIDKWGEYIRNELLNISTFIMRYPEGATEEAIDVFSNERIIAMSQKIEKQSNESVEKKGFFDKDEELKEKIEAKSDDSDEEMIIEEESSRYTQQENGKFISLMNRGKAVRRHDHRVLDQMLRG